MPSPSPSGFVPSRSPSPGASSLMRSPAEMMTNTRGSNNANASTAAISGSTKKVISDGSKMVVLKKKQKKTKTAWHQYRYYKRKFKNIFKITIIIIKGKTKTMREHSSLIVFSFSLTTQC